MLFGVSIIKSFQSILSIYTNNISALQSLFVSAVLLRLRVCSLPALSLIRFNLSRSRDVYFLPLFKRISSQMVFGALHLFSPVRKQTTFLMPFHYQLYVLHDLRKT